MINPKYSAETEVEVLETLMNFSLHTNIRVQKAMLTLTPECFYNPDNKAIFKLIQDCFRKQEPFHFVDILLLVPQNDTELYGHLSWIIDKFGKMHSGQASFEHYVAKLVTLSQLRNQLSLSRQMIIDVQECLNPQEAQDILIAALGEISAINFRESKQGISNIEIAEDYYDGKIVDEIKMPTSSAQMNELLQGGIMPKSLVIVAAGASVGKTGFSIYLTDIIARAQPDTQSLFFSIEMQYKHIWMRHVGICAGKPFDQLNDSERLAAVTKSMAVPIKIYDTAMCHSVCDIDFILTTARLRAMEKPISVIVVDYLGLVETKMHFERNDLKQSYITGKLAQLAIELNCTVIALSQINRGAANRGAEDRCPWPHDAADSSGGHRSASLWLGVDRPELYQDDPCYNNQFVIKCRKNRFGDTFDTIFAFNGGSFAEVPHGWFQAPMKRSKNPSESIFSSAGKDFYADQ